MREKLNKPTLTFHYIKLNIMENEQIRPLFKVVNRHVHNGTCLGCMFAYLCCCLSPIGQCEYDVFIDKNNYLNCWRKDKIVRFVKNAVDILIYVDGYGTKPVLTVHKYDSEIHCKFTNLYTFRKTGYDMYLLLKQLDDAYNHFHNITNSS
jgi:hypothetical protein